MADASNNSRSSAHERRRARRHPASKLPKVHVSILAGPDVKLLDVSPQGLLVESDVRLIPGAAVCLAVKFDNESHLVGGHVARVDTAVAGKNLRYRAGIALDGTFTPFDLPATEGGPSEPAAPLARQATPGAEASHHETSSQPSPIILPSGPATSAPRGDQPHDRRMVEMLKAALQASERSRKDADKDQRQRRESWEQERRTLEQALEIAARHKEKLSAALEASTSEARAAAKAFEEQLAAAVADRDALEGQLSAANDRWAESAGELAAVRAEHQRLERTLDEERAMLAGLLQEKDRLLAELEELRPSLEALSAERDRADEIRRRHETEQRRLSQQLEAAERWCADQHELIYELWQQALRSTALIEGWKSSHGPRAVTEAPSSRRKSTQEPAPELDATVAKGPRQR